MAWLLVGIESGANPIRGHIDKDDDSNDDDSGGNQQQTITIWSQASRASFENFRTSRGLLSYYMYKYLSTIRVGPLDAHHV